MKAARIAVLGVALVIGSSTSASAQAAPQKGAPPTPAGTVRARSTQQLANIDLTAEQKTRLEAITAKYADDNKAAREAMGIDPAQAIKKMMALREKMVPEIRAVLTLEQRAIFDRNMAEMTARMNAMGKPPGI